MGDSASLLQGCLRSAYGKREGLPATTAWIRAWCIYVFVWILYRVLYIMRKGRGKRKDGGIIVLLTIVPIIPPCTIKETGVEIRWYLPVCAAVEVCLGGFLACGIESYAVERLGAMIGLEGCPVWLFGVGGGEEGEVTFTMQASESCHRQQDKGGLGAFRIIISFLIGVFFFFFIVKKKTRYEVWKVGRLSFSLLVQGMCSTPQDTYDIVRLGRHILTH